MAGNDVTLLLSIESPVVVLDRGAPLHLYVPPASSRSQWATISARYQVQNEESASGNIERFGYTIHVSHPTASHTCECYRLYGKSEPLYLPISNIVHDSQR